MVMAGNTSSDTRIIDLHRKSTSIDEDVAIRWWSDAA